MIRRASQAVLKGALRQVARLPLTRRAMHRLSVAARGPSVVFLRCRRLLPDTAAGRAHPDHLAGFAMTPAELEEALRDCQRTLRFIHLAEGLSQLSRGRRIDEGAAVLTFDESFAATAELALPVLRRLGVPCVFFVSTGHMGGTGTLWDQQVHSIVEALAPQPLSLSWVDQVLKTDSRSARAASVRRLLMLLASLDEERLDKRLEELEARVPGGVSPHPLDRMLTTSELARIARDSLVSVGAHGHRHLALASVTERAREEELARPRELLRELCGSAYLDVVSYPFGRPPYVNDEVVAHARRVGYRAGFGAETGVARPGDNLFRLPRLAMGPGIRSVDAYELQGMSEAVDELLLVATGSETRLAMDFEG